MPIINWRDKSQQLRHGCEHHFPRNRIRVMGNERFGSAVHCMPKMKEINRMDEFWAYI